VQDWNQAIEFSPTAEQPNLRIERIQSRLRTGNMSESIAEIDDLTKSSNWNAAQWYKLSCACAFTSDKVFDRKEEFARRAVELMRQAVQKGFRDVARMRDDTNLDSLRGRDDFNSLLDELDARRCHGL
jgi:hypothetical protein